ncbi:MAG: hypothetical protein M1829_001230 [Trizodia sp. TS-e1964]|nr:MAG: hypothetical protein M1829_001230 [Trizodia sp. TS-e1964]
MSELAASTGSTFTASETKLLIACMKNMGGTLNIDFEAVAQECEYKDAGIARTMFNRVKKAKIDGTILSGGPKTPRKAANKITKPRTPRAPKTPKTPSTGAKATRKPRAKKSDKVVDTKIEDEDMNNIDTNANEELSDDIDEKATNLLNATSTALEEDSSDVAET